MSQQFRKELERELTTRCKDIGFKKKKYYNFYKPINESIYATLGFGMATLVDKGHIYVNVTVGLFFKTVEDVYMQITGYNRFEIMQPTIGMQLGYLMPEETFKQWDFVENADNTFLFEDLFMNIKTYGFPYQQMMSNFDRLFDAFEKRERGILNIGRDRYLPILYYLKGDKQKGEEVIKTAIERQGNPISDQELKKGFNRNSVVLRAGSGNKLDSKDFDKLLKDLPSGDSIIMVGSGVGKVSPEYWEFAEKYKLLE